MYSQKQVILANVLQVKTGIYPWELVYVFLQRFSYTYKCFLQDHRYCLQNIHLVFSIYMYS